MEGFLEEVSPQGGVSLFCSGSGLGTFVYQALDRYLGDGKNWLSVTPLSPRSRSVFLMEKTAPPGDSWQCLGTFLVVRTRGGDASGISLVGAGNLLNILQCTGQPSATENYQHKMSILLRFRNPDLNNQVNLSQ